MTTAPAPYPNTQLLINNEWQPAASGKTINVVNPATGSLIGTVAHASIPDMDRALAAAQAGFWLGRRFQPTSELPPCARLLVFCVSVLPILRAC